MNDVGFSGTKMKGSEHNDLFIKQSDKSLDINAPIKQKTNNSGGTLGGITNGENIVRLYFI